MRGLLTAVSAFDRPGGLVARAPQPRTTKTTTKTTAKTV